MHEGPNYNPHNFSGGLIPHNDPDLIGHVVRINQTGALIPVTDIAEYDEYNTPRVHDLPIPPVTEAQRICADPWKRRAVYFMALICVGVFITLVVLAIVHGLHIDRGETSIESAINKKTRDIMRLFKHPYDFGRKQNWTRFLGLTENRTFIRHVLFPSAHRPLGNGLYWTSINDQMELRDLCVENPLYM